MPPGYGYLTHHLPQKVTLARISNSATDEQVWILEIRGKKTQLYNMTMRCLGLIGRKKHTHTTDKLFLQIQTSAEGAAAPSALFPPSVESGPASDGDTGGRIWLVPLPTSRQKPCQIMSNVLGSISTFSSGCLRWYDTFLVYNSSGFGSIY